MKTTIFLISALALVILAVCTEPAAGVPEDAPHALEKRSSPPKPQGPMPKPKPGGGTWGFKPASPPRGAGQVHNPPGGASTSKGGKGKGK